MALIDRISSCFQCGCAISTKSDAKHGSRSTLLNCNDQCLISLCQNCAKESISMQIETFHSGLFCPCCRKLSPFSESDIAKACAVEEKYFQFALEKFEIKVRNNPHRILVNKFSDLIPTFKDLVGKYCGDVAENCKRLRLLIARAALALEEKLSKQELGSDLELPWGPLNYVVKRNRIAEQIIDCTFDFTYSKQCVLCCEENIHNSSAFLYCECVGCNICQDCARSDVQSRINTFKQFGGIHCPQCMSVTATSMLNRERAMQEEEELVCRALEITQAWPKQNSKTSNFSSSNLQYAYARLSIQEDYQPREFSDLFGGPKDQTNMLRLEIARLMERRKLKLAGIDMTNQPLPLGPLSYLEIRPNVFLAYAFSEEYKSFHSEKNQTKKSETLGISSQGQTCPLCEKNIFERQAIGSRCMIRHLNTLKHQASLKLLPKDQLLKFDAVYCPSCQTVVSSKNWSSEKLLCLKCNCEPILPANISRLYVKTGDASGQGNLSSESEGISISPSILVPVKAACGSKNSELVRQQSYHFDGVFDFAKNYQSRQIFRRLDDCVITDLQGIERPLSYCLHKQPRFKATGRVVSPNYTCAISNYSQTMNSSGAGDRDLKITIEFRDWFIYSSYCQNISDLCSSLKISLSGPELHDGDIILIEQSLDGYTIYYHLKHHENLSVDKTTGNSVRSPNDAFTSAYLLFLDVAINQSEITKAGKYKCEKSFKDILSQGICDKDIIEANILTMYKSLEVSAIFGTCNLMKSMRDKATVLKPHSKSAEICPEKCGINSDLKSKFKPDEKRVLPANETPELSSSGSDDDSTVEMYQLEYAWVGKPTSETKKYQYFESISVYDSRDKRTFLLKKGSTILLQNEEQVSSLPYLAFVESLFEIKTKKKDSIGKMLRVKWFYRTSDQLPKPFLSKIRPLLRNEIFYSNDEDHIAVESILQRFSVQYLSSSTNVKLLHSKPRVISDFTCRFSFNVNRGFTPLTDREIAELSNYQLQSLSTGSDEMESPKVGAFIGSHEVVGSSSSIRSSKDTETAPDQTIYSNCSDVDDDDEDDVMSFDGDINDLLNLSVGTEKHGSMKPGLVPDRLTLLPVTPRLTGETSNLSYHAQANYLNPDIVKISTSTNRIRKVQRIEESDDEDFNLDEIDAKNLPEKSHTNTVTTAKESSEEILKSERSRASNPDLLCSFYFSSTGCRFGSSCKYNHTLPNYGSPMWNMLVVKVTALQLQWSDEVNSLIQSRNGTEASSIVCPKFCSSDGCKSVGICPFAHRDPVHGSNEWSVVKARIKSLNLIPRAKFADLPKAIPLESKEVILESSEAPTSLRKDKRVRISEIVYVEGVPRPIKESYSNSSRLLNNSEYRKSLGKNLTDIGYSSTTLCGSGDKHPKIPSYDKSDGIQTVKCDPAKKDKFSKLITPIRTSKKYCDVICVNYCSKDGCHLPECKFVHALPKKDTIEWKIVLKKLNTWKRAPRLDFEYPDIVDNLLDNSQFEADLHDLLCDYIYTQPLCSIDASSGIYDFCRTYPKYRLLTLSSAKEICERSDYLSWKSMNSTSGLPVEIIQLSARFLKMRTKPKDFPTQSGSIAANSVDTNSALKHRFIDTLHSYIYSQPKHEILIPSGLSRFGSIYPEFRCFRGINPSEYCKWSKKLLLDAIGERMIAVISDKASNDEKNDLYEFLTSTAPHDKYNVITSSNYAPSAKNEDAVNINLPPKNILNKVGYDSTDYPSGSIEELEACRAFHQFVYDLPGHQLSGGKRMTEFYNKYPEHKLIVQRLKTVGICDHNTMKGLFRSERIGLLLQITALKSPEFQDDSLIGEKRRYSTLSNAVDEVNAFEKLGETTEEYKIRKSCIDDISDFYANLAAAAVSNNDSESNLMTNNDVSVEEPISDTIEIEKPSLVSWEDIFKSSSKNYEAPVSIHDIPTFDDLLPPSPIREDFLTSSTGGDLQLDQHALDYCFVCEPHRYKNVFVNRRSLGLHFSAIILRNWFDGHYDIAYVSLAEDGLYYCTKTDYRVPEYLVFPADGSVKSVQFGKHQRVEVNFLGLGKIHRATIRHVFYDNTYDIIFDDGEPDFNVSGELISRFKKLK